LISRGSDLLRDEYFGAFYYSRAKAQFQAVTPAHRDLLLAAREAPAIEVYRRDPSAWPWPGEIFHGIVEHMTEAGQLDAEGLCRAVHVPRPPRAIAGVLTGPIATHLELTRVCNLRCKHCYADVVKTKPEGELSLEQIERLCAELAELASPVLLIGGGEPLLRPDFWEVVAALERHRIDAFVYTNATTIDEEWAERLAASPIRGFNVSLDGPDRGTHEILRPRGSFDRTVRGIRNLIRAGARHVKIRPTITPGSLHRLMDFAPIAEDLGVEALTLSPFRQFGEASSAEELAVEPALYASVVKEVRARWSSPVRLETPSGVPGRGATWMGIQPLYGCVGGTTTATVLGEGKVTPCSLAPVEGEWNLHERGFAECWYDSPAFVSWRMPPASKDCSGCGSLPQCGGGCRARSSGMGMLVSGNDPWSCFSHKGNVLVLIGKKRAPERPGPLTPVLGVQLYFARKDLERSVRLMSSLPLLLPSGTTYWVHMERDEVHVWGMGTRWWAPDPWLAPTTLEWTDREDGVSIVGSELGLNVERVVLHHTTAPRARMLEA
jgi:radical SAM protein with 4Fe4S-binding SPASM domain